jgi:glycosyltransferase involved in cell wall biosynthesis
MIDISYFEFNDRFFKGDAYVLEPLRVLMRLRKRRRRSGMYNVVHNTLAAFKKIGIKYRYNNIRSLCLPSSKPLLSFGLGLKGLSLVNKDRPLILAIGFGDFSEYEVIFRKYNVIGCIQHSQWVADLLSTAINYPRIKIAEWPAGVNTQYWIPDHTINRQQFLIYKKLHTLSPELHKSVDSTVANIKQYFSELGVPCKELVYGHYTPDEYKIELSKSLGMIFFSPSESLGFATLEAFSCDVPVLVWSPGVWVSSPNPKSSKVISGLCSSAPYLHSMSGMQFSNLIDWEAALDSFRNQIGNKLFHPREYVCTRFDLSTSAHNLLSVVNKLSCS